MGDVSVLALKERHFLAQEKVGKSIKTVPTLNGASSSILFPNQHTMLRACAALIVLGTGEVLARDLMSGFPTVKRLMPSVEARSSVH